MTNEDIDFELAIEGGKYRVRVFKAGGFDVLRYGAPWVLTGTQIPGAKCWLSLVLELHALRTGQGHAPPLLPVAVAKQLIEYAALPKGADGKTPLPVPITIVEGLISLAVTQDRDLGPIDADAIAEQVLQSAFPAGHPIRPREGDELLHLTKNMIVAALRTAQARGARIAPKITEDDYAEASRAGHEAFMACLKDKGLV